MKAKLFILLIFSTIFSINAQFSEENIITNEALNANNVIAFDIDGDGYIDVLSASQGDNTLAWYKNLDGEGNFSEKNIITNNLESTRFINGADLDGDGDIDVISTTGVDNLVVWYKNEDGLGNFGPQQVITNELISPKMVKAEDIDNDGDLDVLIASRLDNKITWFENLDGLGSFGSQNIISSVATSVDSVFYADLDGDGFKDVIGNRNNTGQPMWFKHLDGEGNFGPEQQITNQTNSANYILAHDLDGDEDLDVIITEFEGDKIGWYENTDGLGDFGPRQVITALVNAPRSIYATDLDNDGDIDLLCASQADDKVTWYENTDGLGNFGQQNIISLLADGPMSVYAADLDGDGFKDAMSASIVDYKVAWYKNLTNLNTNDIDFNNITLYPNPVKNILNIQNENINQLDSVIIYTTLGRIIIQIKSNNQNIDVSNLQSGIYFAEIKTEKGSIVKKFLKV